MSIERPYRRCNTACNRFAGSRLHVIVAYCPRSPGCVGSGRVFPSCALKRRWNCEPGRIVMNVKKLWPVTKGALTEFGKDKVLRLAAALAYYSIFSLAPLVIIVISVAG